MTRRVLAALVLTLTAFGAVAACTPDQIQLVASHFRDAPTSGIHFNRTLMCIRHHESDRGPSPYDRGYRAENPTSTASGAYQFVDGTWRSRSTAAGYGGIGHAANASVAVQDAVAYYTITHGGKSAWAGSGC